MGGRGASSGVRGRGGSGWPSPKVDSTTSLISERERKRAEVDLTLTVLRDVEKNYGVILEDVQLAKMKKGSTAIAYYAYGGNLAVNESYFDNETMNRAYDACVSSGFHPSRGKKSGMEAVVAHEMGHRLTDIAGQKKGYGEWAFGRIDNEIVATAAKTLGMKHGDLRAKISGYAQQNNAECIAEAYADVYCNGGRAKKASREVVKELNKYFYQGPSPAPKTKRRK